MAKWKLELFSLDLRYAVSKLSLQGCSSYRFFINVRLKYHFGPCTMSFILFWSLYYYMLNFDPWLSIKLKIDPCIFKCLV